MKKQRGGDATASKWLYVSGDSTLFSQKGHLSPGDVFHVAFNTPSLGESAGLLSKETRRPCDRYMCTRFPPGTGPVCR